MAHYTDTNLLIVKLMPSLDHQVGHLGLVNKLDRKLARMGIPDEFYPIGGTRFMAIALPMRATQLTNLYPHEERKPTGQRLSLSPDHLNRCFISDATQNGGLRIPEVT